MNVSLLSVFFALLIIAFPIFVIIRYRLPLLNRFVKALLRLVLTTSLVALATLLCVKLNSLVVNIIVALLFGMFAASMSVLQSRLRMKAVFVPVLCGFLSGLLIVGVYTVSLILGARGWQVSVHLVPVMGLLSGGMIGAVSRALEVYYAGLRHHAQLYYYLLGNGSTHAQATEYFLRRALQTSVLFVSRQMSAVVFATAPVIFFVATIAGMNVLAATVLQVSFFIAVLGASLLAVFVALLIGRRYNFDGYNHLKKVFKGQTVESEPSVSGLSLSSPSAPREPDSVSRQQESESESRL